MSPAIPLAGTIGRSGDLATDEALIARLLASPKDRREHAYVIEGLRRTLGPLCDDLNVPASPRCSSCATCATWPPA